MITRSIGDSIPISIATATAFESLLKYKQFKSYNSIYINTTTLIRNAYSCIEDTNQSITPSNLAEIVDDDITKLGIILNNLFSNLRPIIYINSNNKLSHLFPYSKRVIPKTPKQIAYNKLVNDTLTLIKGKHNDLITEYDTLITPHPNDRISIILTSFCIELLSANKFKHMVLLESHTGAIKGRLEWNTKLTNGNKLTNIPFCKFTLSVFGDNNRCIVALPKEYRVSVKELALKGKWTANSTVTLMKYTISNYADPHSKKQLLKLF